MIYRVGRLVRAELLKLGAQRFFYVALVLIAAGVIGVEWTYQKLHKGAGTSGWGSLHALQLFANGWDVGLMLATVVLVMFSSMLIAGEFDRGTIKVLLTRPVTRTDFFLSKAITVLLLAVFLFAFVLFVALAWAFSHGSMGPVWDDTAYLVQRDAADINGHAIRAVGIAVLSFVAAGFLGLMVSTWSESSGYAVAIGLILFLFGYLLTKFMGEATQEKLFFHYGPYAVDKLREFAEGGTTRWAARVVERSSHVTVPLAYIAAFLPATYALVRGKNITA
jgi:ABC-2 type transport system permease protein